MKRILATLVWITAWGCGPADESAVPTPETEASVVGSGREGPTEVEMVASMEAHYGIAILAHDALVQGDLERLGAHLATLSEQQLPPSSPEEWLPLYESLRSAGRAGAEVSDLTEAASALALVVLACGECHAALGTGPVYPAPAPADGATPLETAMLDHQWVTERLWEGVTGPWDNAWERGADALAGIQVFGEPGGGAELSDDLKEREQQLRNIGAVAKTTTALGERAALYGELLSTCGGCHDAIGVEFAPKR